MSSWYFVMPPSALNLKPLNFLSVMKFTTPPTASEPYDADAPPVTTSTRFTSSCGNWLTSVTLVTFAPTTRWPSSRVRVRIVPRPRSDSDDRPCTPLDVLYVNVVRPVLPCRAGSSASVLNRFGLADFARSSAVSVVVGVGWLKPRAAMREPETTTVLTPSWGVAAAGAGAGAEAGSAGTAAVSWAWPGRARTPQALATARWIRVLRNCFGMVSPFLFYRCGPVANRDARQGALFTSSRSAASALRGGNAICYRYHCVKCILDRIVNMRPITFFNRSMPKSISLYMQPRQFCACPFAASLVR